MTYCELSGDCVPALIKDSAASGLALNGPPPTDPSEFVHASAVMQQLLARARRFAQLDGTILINGESGTGKGVLARLIHRWSHRRDRPYVCVNCAALSSSLFESELFGHEAGAFTGASQRHPGRIEFSRDGMLLLDEISEVPCSIQAKLLRVLEEGEFQRVGGNETIRVQARLMATSNRNLADEVEAGVIRQDLYYRLNALALEIPPLRERPEDLKPLVQHFLRQATPSFDRRLSPAAWKALRDHAWPGNIRELRNVIQHACSVTDAEVVELDHLPPLQRVASDPTNPQGATEWNEWSQLRMDEIERRVILFHLRQAHGNKTAVARKLGLTSRTIANKVREYQLQGWDP